jgi:Ca-activated chloride channel family protein
VTAAIATLVAGTGAPRAQQQPPAQQQAPVFRSTASAVRVDVSVRNASRRVIEGLTSADFALLDNGVAQQIDDVSFGKAPIDVTIGLDVSRSVAGPLLDRLRTAVMQLARDLRREDRLRLLAFNLMTQRLVDFTGDTGAVERAMRAATASGGTALFDALSVAMISATEADRRQLVVFFTDGQDAVSTTSPESLLAVAERTRATVSFVVLPTFTIVGGRAASPPPQVRNLTMLTGPTNTLMMVHPAIQKLAAETGGQVLPAISNNLGPLFLQALDAFRATYVLSYTPKGVSDTGFHAIDVQVTRPGVSVQARRGYFAK